VSREEQREGCVPHRPHRIAPAHAPSRLTTSTTKHPVRTRDSQYSNSAVLPAPSENSTFSFSRTINGCCEVPGSSGMTEERVSPSLPTFQRQISGYRHTNITIHHGDTNLSVIKSALGNFGLCFWFHHHVCVFLCVVPVYLFGVGVSPRVVRAVRDVVSVEPLHEPKRTYIQKDKTGKVNQPERAYESKKQALSDSDRLLSYVCVYSIYNVCCGMMYRSRW
jgi:hypothetical protein